MTEENYEYRTSQIMLRNELPGDGKWSIPIIPKFQIRDGDFDDLLLIGFDRVKTDDEKHRNRMVLFFLYDYKFERVWKQPDFDLEKLSGYRAVLSPDFSMYLEMNPIQRSQSWNQFRFGSILFWGMGNNLIYLHGLTIMMITQNMIEVEG